MSYQGLWHRAADDGNRNSHESILGGFSRLRQQNLWQRLN